MARRYRALQNDPILVPFILEGRSTGRQLGGGSYGSVEEIEVTGRDYICAGKKIYEILLDMENEGRGNMLERFRQECRLMSSLRHPNITQFLGLCFLPSPVLLMEKLEGSLDNLLETIPNIPLPMKRSLLEDTVRGLRYLHTHDPQIIHRDLTAKNVLLTSSLQCKITDFGNSRIVNLQPGELAQTLSRIPGTLSYMPPEAFEATAHYGPSLDVFSFGHLALFTLIQVFPGTLLPPTYHNPENGLLVARTEVERRQTYFDSPEERSLGDQHPLIVMIRCCLDNRPPERPTTEQLVTTFEDMKANIEGPFGDAARIDVMRQIATVKAIKARDAEIRTRNEAIEQLQQEIRQAQAELTQKNNEIEQKDHQLEEARVQIDQFRENEVSRLEELQQKDRTVQEKETELQRIRGELNSLQQQMQSERQQRSTEIQDALQFATQRVQQRIQHTHQERITMKDNEISTLREELRDKESSNEAEKQQRDTEIRRLQGRLRRLQDSSEERTRRKDAMISRLQRQLQRSEEELVHKDTIISRLRTVQQGNNRDFTENADYYEEEHEFEDSYNDYMT